MFHNLRTNIFIYYLLTVTTFLGISYYFLDLIKVQNLLLFATVMLCFIVLAAVLISKLSIDPLEEHVQNLQNLSKETLHELNLPISTIKTNLHMLKKNIEDEKDSKRISRIESACTMLQQRYNELDYMIKTQTKQEINEKFDLKDLVIQRVEFFKGIFPHVEFKTKLESTTIITDKTGLTKTIDNIIENGVKYSPKSNIIEIYLDNNNLSIKDYGCGMDEVELLKIFDTYYQSNDNMQGFGIGLNIVKRFCDTHDIGLHFQSKPNIGTTVKLKFKEFN